MNENINYEVSSEKILILHTFQLSMNSLKTFWFWKWVVVLMLIWTCVFLRKW